MGRDQLKDTCRSIVSAISLWVRKGFEVASHPGLPLQLLFAAIQKKKFFFPWLQKKTTTASGDLGARLDLKTNYAK